MNTMSTNRGGRSLKLVLSWLLNRELTDTEIARALNVQKSYYSRHKDDADFPSFRELETLAFAFNLNPVALQVSFGHRDTEELILLDREGLRQYMEISGSDRNDVYGELG